MRSTSDLAGMRTRVRAILMDALSAVWTNDEVDEGLRLALGEYSRAGLQPGTRVRPDEAVGVVTPAAESRSASLAGLTGLMAVSKVWFPYDAAAPEELPRWVDWTVIWDAGTPTLLLLGASVPDGTEVARVFYKKPHALKDLDAAAATTFEAVDADLIVLGAAGHCCNARSVDLAETVGQQVAATPNLAAVGQRYLKAFRAQIAPGYIAFAKSGSRQASREAFYDPDRLGVY